MTKQKKSIQYLKFFIFLSMKLSISNSPLLNTLGVTNLHENHSVRHVNDIPKTEKPEEINIVTGVSGAGKSYLERMLATGSEPFELYHPDGSVIGKSGASIDLHLTGKDPSLSESSQEFFNTIINPEGVWKMLQTLLNKNYNQKIENIYVRGILDNTGKKIRNGAMRLHADYQNNNHIIEGIGIITMIERLAKQNKSPEDLQTFFASLMGFVVADCPALSIITRILEKQKDGKNIEEYITLYRKEIPAQLADLLDTSQIKTLPIEWVIQPQKDYDRMETLSTHSDKNKLEDGILSGFEHQNSTTSLENNPTIKKIVQQYIHGLHDIFNQVRSEHI